MNTLTFSYAPMFTVVMSAVGYTALALSLFLCLRLRALRKEFAALRSSVVREKPTPTTTPRSTEHMSAAVEQWARGNGRPQADDLLAAMSNGSDRVVPPPRAPVDWPRHDEGAERSAADASKRRLPLLALGRPEPPALDVPLVTAGVFLAGNGKDQDRAVVRLNSDPENGTPTRWYSYAVLCDGVGGIGDGARAAETALDTFSRSLEKGLDRHEPPRGPADLKRISESLWEGVEAAHVATRELSRNPLWRGSCSTLDAAVIFTLPDQGTIAMVVHVGDGVVWTLNGHGLRRRVTADKSVSPQALGADQDLRGELRQLSLPRGTRLVLTSDGFEAGLRRRSNKSASGEPVALASSVAATLLRDDASSSEIAQCLGTLAAASSPDDVTVVTVG